MLTQLQQNRRIIQDFTVTSLAAIPSVFGRLMYISSLRDLSSGRYEHAGLNAVYSDEAVQQALAQCHAEIFESILELPLALQQGELRRCLASMSEGFCNSVIHWRRMEAYRVLIPEQAPQYLKELFCSNLRALLEILDEKHSPARSSA